MPFKRFSDFLKGLRPGTRREKHPAIVENHAIFAQFDRSRGMADYRFVVFDTELTGLNLKRDEIVSLGAVTIKELKILPGETFHTYVQPTQDVPKGSTMIHGITPESLKPAPHLSDALPDFIRFCGDAVLVGHFMEIDRLFLNRAGHDFLGAPPLNPNLDTMRMAHVHEERLRRTRSGHNPLQSFNLSMLAEEYGLPVFTRHHALEDAVQTAYLFLFLAKKLESAGYFTLEDYLATQSHSLGHIFQRLRP